MLFMTISVHACTARLSWIPKHGRESVWLHLNRTELRGPGLGAARSPSAPHGDELPVHVCDLCLGGSFVAAITLQNEVCPDVNRSVHDCLFFSMQLVYEH